MSLTEFIIRILAALASGMIIGLEREFHQKRAGLRTHSLVSLGSAIFVLISLKIAVDSGGDPSRIIGQVATGIGFLGAGVILRQGLSVHGLTSAATIWCSAATGSLAASGYYLETAVCTAIVVLVNFALRSLDDRIEALGPRRTSEKDRQKKVN